VHHGVGPGTLPGAIRRAAPAKGLTAIDNLSQDGGRQGFRERQGLPAGPDNRGRRHDDGRRSDFPAKTAKIKRSGFPCEGARNALNFLPAAGPQSTLTAVKTTGTNVYSRGEEIANSLTHGLGLILSVGGLCVLVTVAGLRGDAWTVTGCAVFGASLVLLYGASTCYHALPAPRWKPWLRVFDHAAIFLLIAGSYTPFLLVSLRGPWVGVCSAWSGRSRWRGLC